jgi:hypothetical protein
MMKEPQPFNNPRRVEFDLARRIAKDKERNELENNPDRQTTPFDLQNYFEKTKRGKLCRDVSEYDKHRADQALLEDLALTKNDEVARLKRLRNLSLTNLPKAWAPIPDYSLDEINGLIQKKLTEINRENWNRTPEEPRDDTNSKNWIQLLKILSRGPSVDEKMADESALRFLEGEVRNLYGFLAEEETEGNEARLGSIDKLNKIRLAAYWRYLHPLVEIGTDNPFRT